MRYIIQINQKINKTIINTLMDEGLKNHILLNEFDIVIGDIDNYTDSKLKDKEFIEAIEENKIFENQLANIKITPKIRVNKLKGSGLKGTNIRIAILDSGVDPEYIEVVESLNYTGDITIGDTGHQGRLHGTYVGHIIKEIAPWCKLYSLIVKGKNGGIELINLLPALEWCYKNNIDVINLSLCFKQNCTDTCILCGVIRKLKSNGCLSIAAMGNYGTEGPGVTGCPGNSKDAITVGAVNEYKKIADYSSIGLQGSGKPDVVAPGKIQLRGHQPITGTSFATPIVTGVVACLLERVDFLKISDMINSTTISLGANIPKNHQGNGMINIEKLIGVIGDEENYNTN